jgi:nicotinamidase-related amidase
MTDTAVLVVDMMNSYQHPDADVPVPNVGKIIEPLTDLVRRARESDDVDLVYVNDNYGDFTAQFSALIHSACHGERPELVEPIVPTQNRAEHVGAANNRGRLPRLGAEEHCRL